MFWNSQTSLTGTARTEFKPHISKDTMVIISIVQTKTEDNSEVFWTLGFLGALRFGVIKTLSNPNAFHNGDSERPLS